MCVSLVFILLLIKLLGHGTVHATRHNMQRFCYDLFSQHDA